MMVFGDSCGLSNISGNCKFSGLDLLEVANVLKTYYGINPLSLSLSL